MVPPAPWSLPPSKRDKIRVVFDCSAEYKGEALNKHLLQGPDLTNKLVGVLSRFRQEPVAFMADIEAMFLQVHVTECYQDLLRFLWWENGNLISSIQDDSSPFRVRDVTWLL